MSANATRPNPLGRLILAALTATLLASCSATSDTDGTLFGFSPQYGAAGVPDHDSQIAHTDDLPATDSEDVEAVATDETDAAAPAEIAASNEDSQPQQETAAPVETAADETRPSAPAETAAVTEQGEEAGDEIAPATSTDAEPEQPAKRGFLSAFFSPQQTAAPAAGLAAQQTATLSQPAAAAAASAPSETRPIVDLDQRQPALASAATAARATMSDAASFSNDVLPGVRDNAGLFEISRRSGIDDDSDIDMLEGGGLYQVAYAPGLARLAPNGLLKQREDVDVSCFRPQLVGILKAVERRFGQKVVVTSGYRSPEHNRRVRGARKSQHMACAAADIHVPGVDKMKVAEFVRAMPGRGGVGTYCHTEAIHVDIGPERDWNWRCRRRG